MLGFDRSTFNSMMTGAYRSSISNTEGLDTGSETNPLGDLKQQD